MKLTTFQEGSLLLIKKRALHISLLLLFSLSIANCASVGVADYRLALQEGNIQESEEIISKVHRKKRDTLLRKMHYGTLNQLKNEYQKSNEILEEAKNLAEKLAPVSVTGTITGATTSRAFTKFSGNNFERMMIYFKKSLNYLSLRKFNAARIEISQIELLLEEKRISIKNYPFIPLFMGLMYEAVGQNDNALVAYRRAMENYSSPPLLLKQSYVNLLYKEGLSGELRNQVRKTKLQPNKNKKSASLLTIASRGLMTPLETDEFTYFIAAIAGNVPMAIPKYPPLASFPSKPTIYIGQKKVSFEPIINVEKEMRRAFDKQRPAILALAISRQIVKHTAQQVADNTDNIWVSIGTAVANHVTEVADLRNWNTLPQVFYISRKYLSPGKNYEVEISQYANLIGSAPTSVEIQSGMNVLFLQSK